jgi:hemerythrin
MPKTKNSITDALGSAHVALLADLRKLGRAVLSSSKASLAELRAKLAETRAHITEHFRFEEQDGYMAEVRKCAPRLDRTIRQLAEEHRQLSETLDAIITEATAATGLGNRLREEIRTWIKHVRQHESREDELMQDAFNVDIGTKD